MIRSVCDVEFGQLNTAQLALVHAIVHNAHLDIDRHFDRVSDRLTCSGHG